MNTISYRVEYEDKHYEVKKRNYVFREYRDAADYFKEKFSDNTGRYSNVKLIKRTVVETETVVLESER